jgi:hypothetical protein
MSKFDQLLKSVGAIPKSEEYHVGDEVKLRDSQRSAVVVGVVADGDSFKVKVAYKDKDEIAVLDPTDVQHG